MAMGQILVRKLDDSVVEAVKKRAKVNNRSMQAEIRAILEAAVAPEPSRERRSILSLVGSVRPGRTVDEINRYVRSLRDEWEEREKALRLDKQEPDS
jgi:plasmid stability protein